MLKGSAREVDMSAEKVLGQFLDNYFYRRLEETDKAISCNRIEGRDLQIEGIDVEISYNGNLRMNIDEKASIYYSNTMIPTFAFEIDSIQKQGGETVEGWFVNDNLKTDYYFLMWPNIKCERVKSGNEWVRKSLDSLQVNDFTVIEAMLIRKEVIRKYLERYGWYRERLCNKAEEIRRNNMYNRTNVEESDDFYFYYSIQIAERPVNVVVRKDVLLGLASRAYLISASGMARIK